VTATATRTGARALAEPPPIAHIDDDVIVVEKPPGLVVHPAPSYSKPTLVDLLADLSGGGESQRPGIVHRLDRDTSGLMVVARNEAAHASLAEQIKSRSAVREYTALVEGELESRTGTIDAPVGRDRRRRTRMAVRGSGSRRATTHFEVIERLPADTLVRARLDTGRTHQIRVHFAAIGHPVAGDPEYGTRGRHGLERQFLHATRLSFRHPASGEELSFTSPLPEDLQAALGRARGPA
jgi:23S rRNA pseudouridine1911/1915/1917 synthase